MRFLPFDPQNRPFSGNLLQFSPFFCYMLYGYNGAVLYAPWTDTMQKEGLPVKKKVFALALALILCLGILPLETLAGEPGPWQGGQTGHTHDAYGGDFEYLDDEYHQYFEYCTCSAKRTLGPKEKHDLKYICPATGQPGYDIYECSKCRAMITLPSSTCKHKHKTKKWDDTNHWDECDDCHAQLNVKPHKKGSVKKDADKHWYACTGCDAHLEEAAHVGQYWKHNTNEHWQTCWCGTEIQGTRAPHDTHWDWDESKHWEVCGCGYETKHVKHTFVDGPVQNGVITSTCACGATKDRTLADLSRANYTGLKEGTDPEYSSSEIKHVGLEGLKEGVDYKTTTTVKDNPDGSKSWVKIFESIEGMSTGSKTFTARKKKESTPPKTTPAATEKPTPAATEEPAVEATPNNTTPSDPPAAPPSDPTDPPATPETNVVVEGSPAPTTEPTAAATLKPTPRYTIITDALKETSCGPAEDTEEVDNGCGEKESMGKSPGVRSFTAVIFGFLDKIFNR